MKKMLAKCIFSSVFFFSIFSIASAQMGIGLVTSLDLYQRYTNPEDLTGFSRSSGSALLNLSAGPKIWLGSKEFSLSVEAQANLGGLGYSVSENKGYGHLAIPIIGSLNFAHLSGLNKSDGMGFSVGGGIQYNRTEFYGLDSDFAKKGVVRDYFQTYVAQIGYGFGISGFGGSLLGRFGYNQETKASSFNLGIQVDMNFITMKHIDDPASQL